MWMNIHTKRIIGTNSSATYQIYQRKITKIISSQRWIFKYLMSILISINC